MVMTPPCGASDGANDVSVRLSTSNGVDALPLTPLTITVSGPVVAPVGTLATICVSDQLVVQPGGTAVPLKVTLELPWLDWKPEPVMVSCAPTAAPPGFTLFTLGQGT